MTSTELKGSRFIQIDEEGYFSSLGIRVADEGYGRSLFENLRVENRRFVTSSHGEPVIVEAFDQPLVARNIELFRAAPGGSRAKVFFAYGFSQTIDFSTLKADPWDRFHARTVEFDVPLVFSRSAQMDIFNLADSFDDTSLTIGGTKYPVGEYYESNENVDAPNFWAEKYEAWQKDASQKPGWENEAPAAPLESIVAQLKIPRSRIAVLGCGTGHDAAFFAERGHIVTGVDWSEEAIAKAEQKYKGSNQSLKFVNEEALQFALQNPREFDVAFEHTFFCAITPSNRDKLVKAWSRMLVDQGHLLGIFFILDNKGGPPFGVTEWEVRELLKPHFEFLYWTRTKTSMPERLGKELVVYAKKRG